MFDLSSVVTFLLYLYVIVSRLLGSVGSLYLGPFIASLSPLTYPLNSGPCLGISSSLTSEFSLPDLSEGYSIPSI